MERDGLKTLVAQVARELDDLKRSLQTQTEAANLEFDPTRHLTKVQGKDYLAKRTSGAGLT